KDYFTNYQFMNTNTIKIVENNLNDETNFDEILKNQDVVYHLVSSVMPSTSNFNISKEISENVNFTFKLLESCVKNNIKKVVFISSGGTIYGKNVICPISEECPTNPITTYGIQKDIIEKLLYLYYYQFGLDYKVVRLANPYGPYQRPNGKLGVVTTFTYKALNDEEISVYGDGSVVRDFIFIDDAVKGIINIANSESDTKIYNLGSGYGTSIKEVLIILNEILKKDVKVKFLEERSVDVPINYLDITRYENEFGQLNPLNLQKGIEKTIEFMKNNHL
ncbi:MAG: NAD-dependent epimerase/dehydratase family protein, partial [Clostridia bacterium]|nr:NAD-dependent epimerase/dehydratase family protein [Clostridia bacterium]